MRLFLPGEFFCQTFHGCFLFLCVHMSKLIKLYTLNMYSILHTIYMLIKLLKDFTLKFKVKWKSLSHVWLYTPWNSLGQNTGVGSHFLLPGSSQPRDLPRSPALLMISLPVELSGTGLKVICPEILYLISHC